MARTDLSIIVPYYNGDQFIDRLLLSVKNARHKSGASLSLELLIIIDSPGSDADQLLAKVNAYQLENCLPSVIKNPVNKGVAVSRNIGLGRSSGEYVYFIDQDDEVMPDFFSRIADYITKGFDFLLLNGTIELTDKKLNTHNIYYLKPKIDLENLILDDLIRSPGQVIIKKSILNGLEFPVPSKYAGSDDKFLWILIFHYNPGLRVAYSSQPLYKAHIHGENFSSKRSELLLCNLDIWENIAKEHDLLSIKRYISRNISYLKFQLRDQFPLSFTEKVLGLYETAYYFFRPYKIIRFLKKRFF